METVYLEKRKTHRYVGTYQHLDEWQDVGVARVTPPKLVREAQDFDEGGTYLRWVEFPRGQDLQASEQALVDMYNTHGCHHDWDCCGCQSVRSRIVHRKGRRVVLQSRVAYNY